MKYQEKDQIKNALVKVNLCEECGEKINYRVSRLLIKSLTKRREKRKKKD
jgi:hypothetical protein